VSTWARTESGDVVLPTVGGGETVIETDPYECTRIAIGDALGFVFGEWFLNVNKGQKWFQWLGMKSPPLAEIRASVRAAILGVPLVVSILDLSFTWDRATRNLAYSWSVRITTGQIVSGP
jgi:hypothetical protein